tara:strand:+ start:1270 stop:2757 length:1488 start_codon:yes stop_codon:yes gene_type:complete
LKYYLTIDAGTSVIKTVIFNTNFKQISQFSLKNPVITDNYGKSELNMKIFWELTANCIKSLIIETKIKSSSIIGVGITGNMVGFWPINKKYTPVRNAILWNDTRSSIIFKNKNIFDKIYNITGSITQYGCTIPILKWMTLYDKNRLKKIKHILTCKDWIRFKLTNRLNNDETEVSVFPGDIKNKKLSDKIFKIFNLEKKYKELFPEVKKSNELGGYITKSASKLTYLKEGTPVIIGCGDVIASTLGSSGINKNQKICILGTTCHNIIVRTNCKIPKKKSGLFFASINNTWLETMINVAGTTNIDWVIKNFYNESNNYSKKIKIIKNFEKKYLDKRNNESTLIFLPYMNYGGSISPFVNFNSKAEIFGLLPHHNRFDILTSCYEGIALSIKDCFGNKIKKNDVLYLSGGASKSLILPQLISNTLKIKVKILNSTELGALGICYLISSYLHNKDLVNIVNKNSTFEKTFYPSEEKSNYLNLKYKKYKKIREYLDKIW